MFDREVALIQNPVIRGLVQQGVNIIPDYFYHVPASSSGKYHPSYTVGDEGLYRHVQAAVRIAKMLFEIYDFVEDEQDVIIGALILHDGWKQGVDGSGGHTLHGHPTLARKVLLERVECDTPEEEIYLKEITNCIASHMGKWSTSKYDTEVLPVPLTEMEKFVHQSDYLASRKPLEFNFAVS